MDTTGIGDCFDYSRYGGSVIGGISTIGRKHSTLLMNNASVIETPKSTKQPQSIST